MLVVKHLYNLSYEKIEKAVKDSLVLRRFCRVYFEDVPDDTTLSAKLGFSFYVSKFRTKN
jgi:IS5 family transposase